LDIRKKVLTALRWTAAAKIIGQLASWAITIVVVRLLSPADYGLMAMAVIFLSFLILVNTMGLDAVLVQKRNLDLGTKRQVFGLVIAANSVFFLLLFLAAVPIAQFFDEHRLVPIVRVLSIDFLLLIFETLPQSQLERDIDFKKLSIVEMAAAITGGLTTLALALTGMGVWALVWGHLVTTTSRMIGLNIICRALCRPSFSLRGMKKAISFGGYATVDRVLWFVFSEADKFIGGKILGKDLLGVYAVANHLATLPINKLVGLINSVAFPAFSQVQSEPEKVRLYLLKAVRVVSIVGFPVFLGISSIAPELVTLFLGSKWKMVGLPLQILGAVMPLRLVATLFPPVLWGIGRPDVSATNFLIAAVIMPFAFYFGVGWGPVGLAWAWLGAYPPIFLISATRACRIIKLDTSELLLAMARPAGASVAMYAAVLVVKTYWTIELGAFVQMVQLVAIGSLVYVGLLFTCYRQGFDELRDLLRK
jgi:teichuronic acid exporter